MIKFIKLYLLVILFVLFIIPAYSQQGVYTNLPSKNNIALLPDISVLGNIVGKVSSDEKDVSKEKILVQEIEFSYQGYLYPDIKSDIFFSLHRHENNFNIELEEAYVTFLKLWNNFSLKIGKSLLNFGKVNKLHPHERSYVDQPTVITNFLGEHGLSGDGGEISYLFPLPFFLQIDLGYWWKEPHYHNGYVEKDLQTPLKDVDGNDIDKILVSKEEDTEFSLADKIYSNRLWSSFNITKGSELELGFSFVRGMGAHYLEHKDEVEIFGIDLTYKLWISSFKKLIFQTEGLIATRDVPIGTLQRYGYYNYLGYQMTKYLLLGVRYDWSENIFPQKETNSSLSAIVTRNLTETTRVCLQYKRLFEQEVDEGYVQLIFGLGPHSHPLK
jgi:hypothetical protein